MKKTPKRQGRILNRRLADHLSSDDLRLASGTGTISYAGSGGQTWPNDMDEPPAP